MKEIMDSNKGASSSRTRSAMKPRPLVEKANGRGSEKITTYGRAIRIQKNTTERSDIFGNGYVPTIPDDDSEEHVRSDRKTAIEAVLMVAADSNKESERALKRLNTFLQSWDFCKDQPYKDAIQKLLNGENTDRKIREKIAKYVSQKLGGIHRYFIQLLQVHDWDIEVAGYIVDTIKKEVTEHLGVEVTELKEISDKAERIRAESDRGLMLAIGGHLKTRVRSWCFNNHGFKKFEREWVENPTASFSTVDAD